MKKQGRPAPHHGPAQKCVRGSGGARFLPIWRAGCQIGGPRHVGPQNISSHNSTAYRRTPPQKKKKKCKSANRTGFAAASTSPASATGLHPVATADRSPKCSICKNPAEHNPINIFPHFPATNKHETNYEYEVTGQQFPNVI